MTGSEVIRKLKADGWTLIRVRGSHHLMGKAGKAVPVPIHRSKEIGAGLLAAIEKQTGVKLK